MFCVRVVLSCLFVLRLFYLHLVLSWRGASCLVSHCLLSFCPCHFVHVVVSCYVNIEMIERKMDRDQSSHPNLPSLLPEFHDSHFDSVFLSVSLPPPCIMRVGKPFWTWDEVARILQNHWSNALRRRLVIKKATPSKNASRWTKGNVRWNTECYEGCNQSTQIWWTQSSQILPPSTLNTTVTNLFIFAVSAESAQYAIPNSRT